MVKAVEDAVLALLAYSRTDQPLIIDAGSGWGGPAVEIARRLPHVQIVGYENSPVPFLFSLLRKRIAGAGKLENLTFRRKDFRRADLYRADILVCYLYPGGMEEISSMLEIGREKQTRKAPPVVISNTFSLPGESPQRVVGAGKAIGAPVYVYSP